MAREIYITVVLLRVDDVRPPPPTTSSWSRLWLLPRRSRDRQASRNLQNGILSPRGVAETKSKSARRCWCSA